jgi:hypothetical protein
MKIDNTAHFESSLQPARPPRYCHPFNWSRTMPDAQSQGALDAPTPDGSVRESDLRRWAETF